MFNPEKNQNQTFMTLGFMLIFQGVISGNLRRFFWHVGAHVFCFRDLIYPSSHLSVDMMTLIAFYEGQESKHLDSLHCSFKIGKLWKLTILYTMTITKSNVIIWTLTCSILHMFLILPPSSKCRKSSTSCQHHILARGIQLRRHEFRILRVLGIPTKEGV